MKRYLTDEEIKNLETHYTENKNTLFLFENYHKNTKGRWNFCGRIYIDKTRTNQRFFIKKVKENVYVYNEQQTERFLLTNEAIEFLKIE